MEEKLSLDTKKSVCSTNKDLKHKYQLACPCVSFFISKIKNKKQRALIAKPMKEQRSSIAELNKKETLKLVKAQTIKKSKDKIKNKKQRTSMAKLKREQRSSIAELDKKETLKLIKAETIKNSKDIASVTKRTKRSHVTRIPENGFGTPSLTSLFDDLSNSGKLQLDDDELLKAVQTTALAKKDLDEGKQWNGDIELA